MELITQGLQLMLKEESMSIISHLNLQSTLDLEDQLN